MRRAIKTCKHKHANTILLLRMHHQYADCPVVKVYVTDFPVIKVHVDGLSSARY